MPKCNCGENPFVIKTKNIELYNSLPENHVLKTLMEEHFNIRRFVSEMEEAVKELMELVELPESTPLMTDLYRVSDHLLRTERHHIREESVIMLRLDKEMVPTDDLNIRTDHDDLRLMKRRFAKLVRSLYNTPLSSVRDEVAELSKKISDRLQMHIDTEDTVLYPLALKQIPSDQWESMAKECDKIGYICFTPGKD